MDIDTPVDLSAHIKPTPAEKVPEIQTNVWKEDEGLTEAFVELATKAAICLKEDVEVIPLSEKLLPDENASSHLVTRREQRDVVAYALRASRENLGKRRFIVAIRGSPGIGKSWSGLLYIRTLMQQTTGRRPILF
jgi:pantothenate kinase